MTTTRPPLVDVTDLTLAFPAHVVGTLLPDWDTIPDEYKQWGSRNEFVRCVSDWFYRGLKDVLFEKAEGVTDEDAGRVMRMARACLASFEPKHEHKIAGVAYLLASYFTAVVWEAAK